jgi:hypothetical protein
MARFARDCMTKMNDHEETEVTLGPDTADLSIRVGLHSGPVTAVFEVTSLDSNSLRHHEYHGSYRDHG